MAVSLVAGVMAALVATSILLDGAAAASYTVGGSSGWTIPPNATFYSDWSSAQKLAPGDSLVFNFPTGIHNVVNVPKASYDACSTQNQIGSTFSSGPATVTVASGTHYYICGVAGHCSAGQKLAITVAATAAPSPSPTAATTPSSPTPAAAKTPSSASPASAPPVAPTPAQTPTSIPPTTVSPAPAPTSNATPPTTNSPAPTATTSPPSASGSPAPSTPRDVPATPGTTGANPPAAAGPSGPAASSSPTTRTAVGAVFLLSVVTASLLL